MSELRKKYQTEYRQELKKSLQLKNLMQVPRVQKVVLSMCIPQAVKTPKILGGVAKELSQIAGQKAVITRARQAIANFKLRKGVPLGASVTLRSEKMWTFLERFIHFALPQVRDFRGLSPKSFDGRGNLSIGLKEQIVFPEVDYDKVDAVRGMNITICTTATNNNQACQMLKRLGFPFRKH